MRQKQRTVWLFFLIIAVSLGSLGFMLRMAKSQGVSPPPAAAAAAPTPLPSPGAATADENVVAVVNGHLLFDTTLTLYDRTDRAMAALAQRPYQPDPHLLDRLVNIELVAQAASQHEYAISEADVDASLAAMLAANGRSHTDLTQELARHGVDLAAFKTVLRRLVLVEQFTGVQSRSLGITPDDYLRRLQAEARISFGSAAQLVRAAPTPPPTAVPAMPSPTTVPETAVSQTTLPTPTATAVDTAPDPANANVAPDFALSLLTDDQSSAVLALEDLRGRPVLLSFWTTWCPYCRAQTPALIDAYRQYASDVAFVGVNVREEQQTVARYVTDMGIPYPIVLDGDGAVANAYHVNGFPTTFLLDADGNIINQHVGQLTETDLTHFLSVIE